MAKTEDDEQDKGPIKPSTEFDGLDHPNKTPEIDRSKWMAITNMIFHQGKKEGYTEGLKAGVESYSFTWRFWWNSGTFISGLAVGMTVGSFILILLFKMSGALVIGG